ncbi:saccharopine dehydrogenase family protein [Striga asiatica]|uniref:Saccharopine dehydrogenase family protein n=1 Tax=Striga asiatica TaxID=4170 RepID=A0A5A7PF73_STRAF|nr:saccharopine dehydrogenase family protein [Striga asiatica]
MSERLVAKSWFAKLSHIGKVGGPNTNSLHKSRLQPIVPQEDTELRGDLHLVIAGDAVRNRIRGSGLCEKVGTEYKGDAVEGTAAQALSKSLEDIHVAGAWGRKKVVAAACGKIGASTFPINSWKSISRDSFAQGSSLDA